MKPTKIGGRLVLPLCTDNFGPRGAALFLHFLHQIPNLTVRRLQIYSISSKLEPKNYGTDLAYYENIRSIGAVLQSANAYWRHHVVPHLISLAADRRPRAHRDASTRPSNAR